MQSFAKYLEGKRVAFVGRAGSLFELDDGDYIDSFDVIVRANTKPAIEKKNARFLGSRTHVLYSSFAPDLQFDYGNDFFTEELRYLATCFPYRGEYKKQIDAAVSSLNSELRKRISVSYCDENLFHNLRNKLGCRPFTGIASINDILRFDLEELYITGMTFYQKGKKPFFNSNVSEDDILKEIHINGHHEIEPQRLYLKKLVGKDIRIRVDPILQTILAGQPLVYKQPFSLKRILRKLYYGKS